VLRGHDETGGDISPEAQGAALRESPRWRVLSALRNREFRLLWVSTLFASAGNWIQQITLSWLIYDATGSALLVGSLNGARTLPFLLAGPVGGVLSDRFERRLVLIATQVLLAVLAAGFALMVIFDAVMTWHFFAFTFLTGIGWAINHPVRQAMVADTLPRSEIMNGVALVMAAFNVNRIAGPAVGGLLIALLGPGPNFLIQALFFTAVAVIVLPMRTRQHEGHARSGSALSDFKEGINYVRREPATLSLLVMIMIPAIFILPFTSGLMPVFAEDVLRAGPSGLGLLLSAYGVGALVGPLAIAMAGDLRHRGGVVIVAGLLTGLTLAVFSQLTVLPIAMGVLVVAGAALMVYHAMVNTLLQTITPDAFRGRVMSLYMMDHGLVPLGSVLAGGLAQAFGAPLAFLVGGAVATLLVVLAAVRFRSVREL